MDLSRFDTCAPDDAPRPAVRLYPARAIAPEVVAAYITPAAIRRAAQLVTSREYEAWKAKQTVDGVTT